MVGEIQWLCEEWMEWVKGVRELGRNDQGNVRFCQLRRALDTAVSVLDAAQMFKLVLRQPLLCRFVRDGLVQLGWWTWGG